MLARSMGRKVTMTSIFKHRLLNIPTIGDLERCYVESAGESDEQATITWRTRDGQADLRLAVQRQKKDGADAEWSLNLIRDRRSDLLWTFKSDDVSLVHNALTALCGEPVQPEDNPSLKPRSIALIPDANTHDQMAANDILTSMAKAAGGGQIKVGPDTLYDLERIQIVSAPSGLNPKQVDMTLVDRVKDVLHCDQTGVFSFSAFLFFLEKEYKRAVRKNLDLSVVVLRLQLNSIDPFDRQIRSNTLVHYLALVADKVKRDSDVLARYQDSEFAFVLPDTTGAGAALFAYRLRKALCAELSSLGLHKDEIDMALGISSMSSRVKELNVLLSMAEEALGMAAGKAVPIAICTDKRPAVHVPGWTDTGDIPVVNP